MKNELSLMALDAAKIPYKTNDGVQKFMTYFNYR